jgi:hypothetical protein
VTARVIGTGVMIDLSGEPPTYGELVVAVELFADLVIDEANEQHCGPTYFAEVDLDRDPTNQLVEAAHIARESNLGTVFGDLKNSGVTNLTRFEFYAAPFRIELTDALRERLVGS